jgi:hypothetical protein
MMRLSEGQNLTVYLVEEDRVILTDDDGNKYEFPVKQTKKG